jgi:hypothetical protein
VCVFVYVRYAAIVHTCICLPRRAPAQHLRHRPPLNKCKKRRAHRASQPASERTISFYYCCEVARGRDLRAVAETLTCESLFSTLAPVGLALDAGWQGKRAEMPKGGNLLLRGEVQKKCQKRLKQNKS